MAKELALIGCGNMGTAMLKGIVGSGLVAAQDVTVADVSETSQQRLAGCEAAVSRWRRQSVCPVRR